MIEIPPLGRVRARVVTENRHLIRDLSITPAQSPTFSVDELRAGKILIFQGVLPVEFLARPNPETFERKLYLNAIIPEGVTLYITLRNHEDIVQRATLCVRLGSLDGRVPAKVFELEAYNQ